MMSIYVFFFFVYKCIHSIQTISPSLSRPFLTLSSSPKQQTTNPSPQINDYDNGCEAIKEMFMQKNRDPDKQIYPHVTCATDTGNVAAVFDAVKDIIIRRSLGDAGLV